MIDAPTEAEIENEISESLQGAILSLYHPPDAKQEGEFTATDAARLWRCEPDHASTILKKLVRERRVTARIGVNEKHKRTFFYKKVDE